MVREQLTREEAVQFLTMQRDLVDDVVAGVGNSGEAAKAFKILAETGDKIGYAPAFRCLVKGLEPEESIRWGK